MGDTSVPHSRMVTHSNANFSVGGSNRRRCHIFRTRVRTADQKCAGTCFTIRPLPILLPLILPTAFTRVCR